MKKLILLGVFLLLSFSLFGCSQTDTAPNPGEEQTDNKSVVDEVQNGSDKEENNNNVIELQGFKVIIPPGYEGTGGHDGVKYINAVVTPKDPGLAYEIEVGYGMAATSSDFDSLMFVRGSYNDAAVLPVITEEWLSPGNAYTFIRTHGRDSGAFTKFQEDKGPSQVMGIYRDYQWLEAELRVKAGSVSDYPDVLAEFMAVSIDWQK